MRKISMLLCFLFPIILHAQHEADTWYFGEYAGLDFSSGAPVAIMDGKMNTLEGCASISDAEGNILFYTNGLKVWDAAGDVMPNGTGLMGNASTTQCIIVPRPGSGNQYYIFYADNEGGPKGLRYSEINMQMNAGMGDVVPETKNTLLNENSTEKMSAVSHCNKKDYWLMTMDYVTDEFYAYLITSNGIDTMVASPAGVIEGTCCSSMKFSPDGKWVAYTNILSSGGDDSQLYEFDNATGIATYKCALPRNPLTSEQLYGLSFSSNNSKLYIGSSYNADGSGVFNALYQYDMTAMDIPASRVMIYKQNFPGTAVLPYPFSTLQNGPDGKIYLARWAMWSALDTIAVINDPNMAGLACNFDIAGVVLNGRNSERGLPNFVESIFNTSAPEPSCADIDTTTETTTNIYSSNHLFFNIYPAISTGMFYVSQTQFPIDAIEAFNISGQLVYSVNGQSTHNNIDLSSDAEGIYFIRITSGNSMYVKQVTVAR